MKSDELLAFKNTYISECLELLTDMEERLLNLDENPSVDELNAIFRCAHSIKGGAGAFGFSAIAQFTHVLEALLDKLREGKIAPSRQVTDLLLKSRDIVMSMVVAARDDATLPEGFGKETADALAKICHGEAAPTPQAEAKPAAVEASGMQTYRIHFAPHPEMLLHGNEPLLLLRELKRLGECQISCDLSQLPPLARLDVEQCQLRWDIVLRTDRGEAAVREVFEFVEGECVLRIEIESARPKAEAVAAVKVDAPAAAEQPRGATSIRVDIEKVDRLVNMVGEIVIIQAMLAMQTRHLSASDNATADLLSGIGELTTHTRELQEAVMAVRMQPVKSIFSRMPRLVRDLSGQLGKQIRLTMAGENTEVDKTIIEQLSDPLTHMLRNSIDHGIEMPDVRVAAGKPALGSVTLSAAHRGGRIVIEVADDGAGINRERVLAKARERGLVAKDAHLTDSEIDQLIFAPGFSTAAAVTDISGRGVGMDVVKRNIEGIGGTVMVANQPGQGAQFLISLPLTLAILDGMIVRVASEQYIIPIANIIETLRPKTGDVRQVADGQSVINIRGEFVPVLYVHRVFGTHGAVEDASKGLVVLVENGRERIGLVVDELVGQQQVVIKTLEDNTDPVQGVSGATILGDGKVSLILDIAGLRRMASTPHQPDNRIAA
ncbi:MAG: chemotaxis protein CheA [Proteobacteria bacterium]|nr:chemotaxis protein CheA [Pseudomonadota bacterium]